MDIVLICLGIVVSLGLLNQSIDQLRIRNYCMGISHLFMAASFLLMCWAFTSNTGDISFISYQLSIFVIITNAGLICYFLAVFLFFIDYIQDPFFPYSPFVLIIGISLVTIFVRIVNQVD